MDHTRAGEAEHGGRVLIGRAGALDYRPTLAIVMPCFAGGSLDFLAQAVSSVLRQGFLNFELFALTGNPDDWRHVGPEDVFPDDPRLIRLALRAPAVPPAVHYGEAILRSRGGYVLLLPAPAILRSGALEAMLAVAHRRTPRDFYYFGGPEFRPVHIYYDLLLRDNLLKDAALLVPREVFARVGLPDPHPAIGRHFLWDLAVRLLHHLPSDGIEVTPPLIERSAAPPTRSDADEAVARRRMLHDRSEQLLPECWRQAAYSPGVAADERPLRVTVLATCNFLDTANVFVEQALLAIARDRPLHYRLLKAEDASDADVRDADVLVLSRTLFAGWDRALHLARQMQARRKAVLFLMDDDLLDLPTDIVINQPVPVAERLAAFVPWLSGLVVASPRLQARMQNRYPGLRVFVRDNSCAVEHAPARRRLEPNTPGRVRVALPLTSSALPRVRAFAGGLHELPADVRAAVELHVFGEVDAVRELLPFPHQFFHRHRPYLEYLALLMQLRPELAWVPLLGDHDFYHCKTAIKYYEFAGLEIPGIYSRVPIYEAVIRHGENGWLVGNTADDWEQAITTLVRDAGLRARLAAAARADVLANHHVRRAADAWWELLRAFAASPVVPAAA
jgi:glycosyltransferase involved in cell wall biosynthesis